MAIALEQPDKDGLDDVVAALRAWQDDAMPFQLHPGDVGWLWRFGWESTAAAVRAWRRDGTVVAAGELDDHRLMRLGIAPECQQDEELAQRIAADLADPDRGVLEAGRVQLEAPPEALLREVLAGDGWQPDESWTPLRRRLDEPVEDLGIRVETVRPEHIEDRVAVQRAAFATSTFSAERWQQMAAGPAYADARCLVAYDGDDVAVATVTVWSAGTGRPGLLEPMGVHRDHRQRGHGRAVTVAAAAALQEMGSLSATVCTPTSNVGGIATYRAAGFEPLDERLDMVRPATEEG